MSSNKATPKSISIMTAKITLYGMDFNVKVYSETDIDVQFANKPLDILSRHTHDLAYEDAMECVKDEVREFVKAYMLY